MDLRRGLGPFLAVAALALAVALPARAQLPEGFTARDIGEPGAAGSTTYDAATGKFTVKGGGGDLWGADNDHFQFVSRSVTGDGMITARMLSTTGGHLDDGWEKTGVMIRETDQPSSPMAHTEMTFRAGIFWHWRETDGGDPHDNEQVGPRQFPVWMRTQRQGNDFSGFISYDGVLWQNIGTNALTMGNAANFGLCVMSHMDDLIDTVEFDNVSVQPGVVSVYGVTACGNDTGVLLQWKAVNGATGYNVYRGPAGGAANLSQITGDAVSANLTKIADAIKETTFTDNANTLVPGQRQFYAVAAVTSAGEGPKVGVRAGRAGGQPVPGFTDASVGNEGVACPSAVGSELDPATGIITVRGAGPDIGGSADEGFQFLNQQATGNFRVTAKVVAKVFHTANSAKGGLMIRDALTPGARNAYLPMTGAHGIIFQSRAEKDGDTDASSDAVLGTNADDDGGFRQLLDALAKGPVTLRLTRQGDTITPEYSLDGTTFQAAGTPVTISGLASAVFVGIAVTSNKWDGNNADTTRTATQMQVRDIVIEKL